MSDPSDLPDDEIDNRLNDDTGDYDPTDSIPNPRRGE